ncbi:aminotransferase class V [Halococcus morrhuae DSM 1307]|uniref:Aminotransferase class V n=2 Tax=Halococcus TaxID=2249 RepID=M0MFV9_HALMO|nr:aminotransferase class V [Halococcus morrhuae DSM 1307]
MLMTPGPTAVPEPVRDAMSHELINPDVESEFDELYDRVCEKLSDVYGTDDQVIVTGGEGILGLESAVACLVDEDTDVLCLSNGLYGDGFADFVESYGGNATVVGTDYDTELALSELDDELAAGDYDVATLVHCETPTGVLNDIEPVLERLHDHGAVTILDAVSSLGGVPVPTENVDVCLGASQKCFSAPPGLATASVSERAWERMEAIDPESLYTNFLPWRDTSAEFPYTHLSTNVVALDVALDRILDEGLDTVYERHRSAASRCRERGSDIGLELFAGPERSSPTVSAFHVPGRAADLQAALDEQYDITLATGLGPLADDVIRVGHMGHQADTELVERTMDALAETV